MGVHVSGTNIDDVIILWEIFFNVDIHSTHSATSKMEKNNISYMLKYQCFINSFSYLYIH